LTSADPPSTPSSEGARAEERPTSTPRAGDQPLSQRVGRYEILGVLGRGGFGIVYEALQREPIERRVALKVIQPGMGSETVVARFEAERQALAMMSHPSVYEAGLTEDSQPFFAMELVRGDPITAYCDRERLNTRERQRADAPRRRRRVAVHLRRPLDGVAPVRGGARRWRGDDPPARRR